MLVAKFCHEADFNFEGFKYALKGAHQCNILVEEVTICAK